MDVQVTFYTSVCPCDFLANNHEQMHGILLKTLGLGEGMAGRLGLL
jgi:hypothetical protein